MGETSNNKSKKEDRTKADDKKLKDRKRAVDKKVKDTKKADEKKAKEKQKAEEQKAKEKQKAEEQKAKDSKESADTIPKTRIKTADTTSKDRIKAADEKLDKTTSDEEVEVVAGKLSLGIILSMAVILLVIYIVTFEFTIAKVEALETLFAQEFPINNVAQGLFIITPHSFSFMKNGFWSIIAALVSGAYIGGLAVRSIKKGILVGIISLGLLIFLQLAIGFLFNITAYLEWLSQVNSVGGNVLMDLIITTTLLVGAGVMGGMLSRE